MSAERSAVTSVCSSSNEPGTSMAPSLSCDSRRRSSVISCDQRVSTNGGTDAAAVPDATGRQSADVHSCLTGDPHGGCAATLPKERLSRSYLIQRECAPSLSGRVCAFLWATAYVSDNNVLRVYAHVFLCQDTGDFEDAVLQEELETWTCASLRRLLLLAGATW